MDELQFEWDEEKNAANVKNHHIDFNDAMTEFADEYEPLVPPPFRVAELLLAGGRGRFLLHTEGGSKETVSRSLLFVVFCCRSERRF